MSLVLDAIEKAGDKGNDKAEVLTQLQNTKDRKSVLGTYSIDKNGDSTITDYGAYTIEGGALKFAKTLKGAAVGTIALEQGGRAAGPSPRLWLNSPTVEAASARAPAASSPLATVRKYLSRYGLIALLLVLPVAYGINDLVTEGDLSRLGNNLVDGISNGAIWALIALGYTLVYGIIELINFAHGEVFMLGSFVAVGLWGTLGLGLNTGAFGLVLGLFATLLVAMATSGSLNVMIERVGYRPLRNAPQLAALITAVGFSFILQNVGLLWLGGSPRSVPDLINSQDVLASVAGVSISNGDVLAVVATAPLVLLLTTFVARSRMGKAMRATAQDPEAARLMGINVDTTISLTFLLGGLLAGAAGLIYALYQTTIWYFQGFQAGLIAFTAAVMGGIGNLRGAVLGGLIIGCIQQIAENRIPNGAAWVPVVVFGYLVLIMVLRPRGLLGEETREAG